MTLRHLTIFEAVCRRRSITRAAEELYLAQPSVSGAIAELEREYGVRLFDRIGRRLYITPDGERLLGYTHTLLGIFGEMEQSLRKGGRSGRLRVGTSITIGTCLLPTCASRFQAEHPEIRVEAVVDRSDAIEKLILQNTLDLAFIEGIPHSEQLAVEAFAEDALTAVCAPDSPLLREAPLSCERLAQLPLLLREKGSGTRGVADNVFAQHGLSPQPLWESTSTRALVEGVQMGVGVSILPRRLIAHELGVGTLAALPVMEVAWARKFYRIRHKNKVLSEAAEDWAQLMTACAGEI